MSLEEGARAGRERGPKTMEMVQRYAHLSADQLA